MGGCVSRKKDTPKVILCYGASLTAGTSPPGMLMFPYAPALERALRELPGGKNVTVKHRGLPGWTCQHMVRAADEEKTGLRDFIRSHQDPAPSLVVILAGTIDLEYIGQAKPVIECISALHKLCWDSGMAKTVAIGLPQLQSAYQANHLDASNLYCEVNEALKDFCESNPRASYIQFPFGFRKDRWASDGLHLTKDGYNLLGTSLAPFIAEILNFK